MKTHTCLVTFFILHSAFSIGASAIARAQSADEIASEEKSKIVDGVTSADLRLSDAKMQWWRDAKFGLFIHWGIYAIPAQGEWYQHNAKIPNEEYAKYAARFNPQYFNAADWAAAAKAAGMKYVVLTTRHHDGFALWDSPASHGNFTSVKAAPAHRDFVSEYAKAIRAADLRVGFYYSPMDWRFPGYFKPKELPDNAALMKKQGYGQVEELMSRYGKIDILWYDGGWLAMKGSDADAAWFWEPLKLNTMVRKYQPDIVISPRSGWEGDFICNEGGRAVSGPIIKRAWEKCLNLNQTAWGYTTKRNLMSRDHAIDMFVNVIIRGGNMLLNVGPDADGVIPPADVARLKEIGDWMRTNSEAIYATRAGPYEPVDKVCGTTCKGAKFYLHLLNTRGADTELKLPPLPQKIIRAHLLQGGASVRYEQTKAGVTVTVPPKNGEPDMIVVFEMDKPLTAE